MAQLALIFKWFVVSSAQAAILVCLVLAVQGLFGRRLGARWQWALWLLVVARLCLPWAPESSMSIFNAVPALGHQAVEATPVAVSESPSVALAQPAVVTMPAVEGGAALEASTVQQASPAQRVPEQGPVQPARGTRPAAQTGAMGVVAFVWLLGAVGLAAYAAGQGLVLAMRLRREPRVSEGGVLSILEECKAKAGITTALAVVETRWVKSPALFGIRRPMLLLPEGTTGRLTREELGFVFLHELAHLKRHDLEINWLVSALQFAHWFNPVLWYGFYRMRADREVACDALVLSHTQPGEAARYGRTIVGLLEGTGRPRRLAGMVGILEDKSQLKRRITMIAKFQPGARKWSVLAVVVLAVLAAMTLTNAKGAASGRQPMVMALGQAGPGPVVGQAATGAPGLFAPPVEAPDPEAAEVRKKLEKRIASFDFSEQPIEQVVEFLRSAGKVNIVLDRVAVLRAFYGPGIDDELRITLAIEDATIASILDLISTQLSANWTVVKNYVYISDEPGIEQLLSRGPEGGKGAISRETRQRTVGGYSGGGEKFESIFRGLSEAEIAAAKAALTDANIEYRIEDGMLIVKRSDTGKVFRVLGETNGLRRDISKQMEIAKISNDALPSVGSGGGVVPGELWITQDDIRLQEGQYCRFVAATVHSKRMTSLDVQLAAAASELKRMKAMFEKGAAAAPDFEKAQAGYDELKAKVAEQSVERRVRDVQVKFYLGDPEKGGKEIGTGGLDVNLGEEATEAIPWDSAPGSYEIFVVIGPGSADYRGVTWTTSKVSTTVKIEAPFELKEQATEAK